MDDVYRNLARHLDNLPAGFPATDSGIELRILKRLFTPEEARLATALTMMPEPLEAIAARAGADPSDLAGRLDAMSRSGLILRTRKGDTILYMAAQFMIGIWEYHVNSLDKDLIRDFNEYVPYLVKDQTSHRTQQLRVIPVAKSISADMNVMGYDTAESIIRSQSKIVVAPCICRKEHTMVGKGCQAPLETCLVFAGGAHFYEGNGLGRAISQDEAIEILHRGIDAGLVLQPGNSQKPLNICMCCGCCCQMLKNIKQLDMPAKAVCSSYFASVDADRCVACGICEERCPMEAVTLEETARVDTDRCIGCGLCAAACEVDAIRMLEKADDEKWVPPRNVFETYLTIAKERGKI